jgi:hypothetical protein
MFSLDVVSQAFVLVLGVDQKGNVLGSSEAWDWGQEKTIPVCLMLPPARFPLCKTNLIRAVTEQSAYPLGNHP